MQKDVHTMAAINNNENGEHTAQQRVKKIATYFTKHVEEVNCIIFLMQYIELHYIFKVT
jgi:hypothetical protein